jgi:hypothetical protein
MIQRCGELGRLEFATVVKRLKELEEMGEECVVTQEIWSRKQAGYKQCSELVLRETGSHE